MNVLEVLKVASGAGTHARFHVFISIAPTPCAIGWSAVVHNIFDNLYGYVEQFLNSGSQKVVELRYIGQFHLRRVLCVWATAPRSGIILNIAQNSSLARVGQDMKWRT